jgi:hypothetical protein
MGMICSSETSVDFEWITGSCIPEDGIFMTMTVRISNPITSSA